jgi:pyridoxamine 5'-phosphate oxidase
VQIFVVLRGGRDECCIGENPLARIRTRALSSRRRGCAAQGRRPRRPRASICPAFVQSMLRTAIIAVRPVLSTPVNIADIRREYLRAALTEADVDPDPLRQFERWLSEAIRAELPEPTAMTLATADADGRPSARIVLLKGAGPEGFVFFTNYESRKGDELAVRPDAALLFHWVELERQARIEGRVAKVPAEESDAYFATRPFLSRVGARASPQSRVIPDRAWLEREFAAQERVATKDAGVPRPTQWGGYRLAPTIMEFWQGRSSRLHDRIRYRREDAQWRVERLAP